MKSPYEAAIDEIIADIKYRKGLGDEWYATDDDIQAEIRMEWVEILKEKLNGGTK